MISYLITVILLSFNSHLASLLVWLFCILSYREMVDDFAMVLRKGIPNLS